jgi:HTH-type transcriptional regulator/antitoxin HigA
MRKGERNLAPEEDALLDLLTNLIRDYEATAHLPRKRSKPHEALAFLLEQGELRQSDLAPVLGSKSRASEILNGKRSVGKAQAKKLAEFFRVSVDLFL